MKRIVGSGIIVAAFVVGACAPVGSTSSAPTPTASPSASATPAPQKGRGLHGTVTVQAGPGPAASTRITVDGRKVTIVDTPAGSTPKPATTRTLNSDEVGRLITLLATLDPSARNADSTGPTSALTLRADGNAEVTALGGAKGNPNTATIASIVDILSGTAPKPTATPAAGKVSWTEAGVVHVVSYKGAQATIETYAVGATPATPTSSRKRTLSPADLTRLNELIAQLQATHPTAAPMPTASPGTKRYEAHLMTAEGTRVNVVATQGPSADAIAALYRLLAGS